MTPEPPPCPWNGLTPPPELARHLVHGWTIGPVSGGDETVLPDGTIDIVWPQGQAPIVAGPDTGPTPSTRPPGTIVAGVSLRPGAAPILLGVPASDLRDRRVPLAQIWGAGAERLERHLDGEEPPAARLKLIAEELRHRLRAAEPPDRLVTAAITRLRRYGPGHIRTISAELEVSERQLRRRFHAAVGYGPRTMARILRFQHTLALARRHDTPRLARLALDAGYADQAHMTTEFVRLAGASPARLLARRYLLRTGPG